MYSIVIYTADGEPEQAPLVSVRRSCLSTSVCDNVVHFSGFKSFPAVQNRVQRVYSGPVSRLLRVVSCQRCPWSFLGEWVPTDRTDQGGM